MILQSKTLVGILLPRTFTDGHRPFLDETLLKEIELEKEFMNSWLDQEKALEESKQEALEAKQREEEERRQKEEAKLREEEERRQKEELLTSRKSAYEQLIKSGMPKEEALKILNLKEAP